MRKVRVSVCTTHYNGWPSVHDFLVSLMRQLPDDAELVMVDAGSRDKSVEYLHDMQKRDRRFRLFVAPGCKRGAGRDQAWGEAQGEAILHIDADRTWKPDGWKRVEAILPQLSKGPLKLRSPLGQIGLGGFLFKRSHLVKVDGYDETLQYFEDVDLLNRLRTHWPLPEVDFDVYLTDDKSKMKKVGANIRYYREMFRDGARMRIGFDYLASGSRGHWRRELLVRFVGRPAYRRGLKMPPARSVDDAATARPAAR
ncbi:MAG TPA: glycosyltransferase family A protein [Candidatus Thermoplasmatota archaeon]|nr:glycosyltransferase family A protein [Candidatus Thermoplasmatota archaeon]